MPISAKPAAMSFYFLATNAPAWRQFHCNWCMARVCDLAGDLVMAVDNPGPFHLAPGELAWEVPCPRCHQLYRFYTPPAEHEAFVPVVTVNGVPI